MLGVAGWVTVLGNLNIQEIDPDESTPNYVLNQIYDLYILLHYKIYFEHNFIILHDTESAQPLSL